MEEDLEKKKEELNIFKSNLSCLSAFICSGFLTLWLKKKKKKKKRIVLVLFMTVRKVCLLSFSLSLD